MKDNPQRLFDRKSEKEYWKKTPWKKIWKKIRERIFDKKSVIKYLKEYSKENPRKSIRKKIREKIFERKSRIFFCIFFREGYSYAYAMKALIPLSIRLPPPLMASFISRFIEKSKNKGNPLESCLLLRRLQTYVKMRANMFNCTRFPFKCSFADFLSNIHLRIFFRIFFLDFLT